MSFNEICTGGGVVVIVMTIIQLSPIKIDPWSWAARMVGRAVNGDVIMKMDQLAEDIQTMKQIEDEREAIRIRLEILKFCEELYKDEKHSKERFDQILQYITEYQKYCDEHPEFPNEKAVLSIAYIEDVYHKRLEKHDFL